MNKVLPLGFAVLSAGLILLPGLTSSANAQCVMTDISIQAAIRGSKNPAKQTNDVDLGNPQTACFGNTSTHTSTQLYVGGADRIVQQRDSKHRLQSLGDNPTGIDLPIVRVPIEVKVDVYNPAEPLRKYYRGSD